MSTEPRVSPEQQFLSSKKMSVIAICPHATKLFPDLFHSSIIEIENCNSAVEASLTDKFPGRNFLAHCTTPAEAVWKLELHPVKLQKIRNPS